MRPVAYTLPTAFACMVIGITGVAYADNHPINATLSLFQHVSEITPSSVRVMAFEGDRLAVGAQTYANGGGWRLYTFSGGTWTASSIIQVPGSSDLTNFVGTAIAMRGDAVAVADTQAQVAHVFVEVGANWNYQQAVQPTVPGAAWINVSKVSLDGDNLAVSMSAEVGGDTVYPVTLHHRTGGVWTQEATVYAPVPMDTSFSQNIHLVGDSLLTTERLSSGALMEYVRQGTTWVEQTGPSICNNARLSRDGNRVAVACPNTNTTLYKKQGTSWNLIATLPSPVAPSYSTNVRLQADRLAVQWHIADHPSVPMAGSVFVYRDDPMNGWGLSQTVYAPMPQIGERFGEVAELAPTHLAVVGGSKLHLFHLVNGAALGKGRAANADCASGYCVEGVCCDEACGGNASDDCQSCLEAMTGMPDGTCAVAPAATVCRPAAGPCDMPEECTGAARMCPFDFNWVDGSLCEDDALQCSTGVCDTGVCQEPFDCNDGGAGAGGGAGGGGGFGGAGGDAGGAGGPVGTGGHSATGGGGAAPITATDEPKKGCTCDVPGSHRRAPSRGGLLALGALVLAGLSRRARARWKLTRQRHRLAAVDVGGERRHKELNPAETSAGFSGERRRFEPPTS